MPRRVAILQSNYIPWKGYFDLMNLVDEFIIYDQVQFTKNDWRNRNRIMTPSGPAWLTIPVSHSFGQSIEETRISDGRWADKHWKTFQTYYAKAPFFPSLAPLLMETFAACREEVLLSAINLRFIRLVAELLGIGARIVSSREYELAGDRCERLTSLCRQAGATEYLSGPAARDYLDEELFAESGIAVRWMDYSGYPEYPQLHAPPFVHEVSVLDLLFNVGPGDAPSFMRSFGKEARR